MLPVAVNPYHCRVVQPFLPDFVVGPFPETQISEECIRSTARRAVQVRSNPIQNALAPACLFRYAGLFCREAVRNTRTKGRRGPKRSTKRQLASQESSELQLAKRKTETTATPDYLPIVDSTTRKASRSI